MAGWSKRMQWMRMRMVRMPKAAWLLLECLFVCHSRIADRREEESRMSQWLYGNIRAEQVASAFTLEAHSQWVQWCYTNAVKKGVKQAEQTTPLLL